MHLVDYKDIDFNHLKYLLEKRLLIVRAVMII